MVESRATVAPPCHIVFRSAVNKRLVSDLAIMMQNVKAGDIKKTVQTTLRVATGQGKVREKCFFSRSWKCQGILKFVREKLNFGKCHGKLTSVREKLNFQVYTQNICQF